MLLRSLRLIQLLSFNDAELELRPLNVLIGPNASGKSNVIAAIGLLKAAPANLETEVARGGGIRQWISKRASAHVYADVEAQIDVGAPNPPLSYSLVFGEEDLGFHILIESLALAGNREPVVFGRKGRNARINRPANGMVSQIEISTTQSLFAAFRDPADPTPITRTGQMLGAIEIFHEFDTGPNSSARNGVAAGTQKTFLYDGGGNLALVLQELHFRAILEQVNKYLRRLWEGAEDVRVRLEGGIAQTYIKERGIEEPIAATRLSDGTLKFLCLMAILLHPEPPPLICIEEPELGLHPDAQAIVADALKEASQRCQIIVTTHSEALVSQFSDDPESVVVCERGEDGGSQFRRLESKNLDEWLQEYRLGELWRKGEIGGNRW